MGSTSLLLGKSSLMFVQVLQSCRLDQPAPQVMHLQNFGLK